jgi:hypothetical protein
MREAHRDEAIFIFKENQLPQESWYCEVSGGFIEAVATLGAFYGGDLHGNFGRMPYLAQKANLQE